MFAEEGEHLVPTVGRLLRAIGRTRGVEKGVAGAVVAVELVSLAELLEHGLGAIDLVAVGIFVVVAEQAEQRAAQLCREIDGRDRALGVELLGVVDDDVAAPAVDRRVDAVERAGGEIGVAPARAEADHSDLAVGIGLGAQKLHGARDVAENLLVGDAAGRAHAGADVVGTAGAFAEIEVRRDRRQSMMGELAGRLLDPFIPPGHVMDQDDAGPRPAAERPRVIGFAHIPLMAAKGDRLREHTFIGHGVPRRSKAVLWADYTYGCAHGEERKWPAERAEDRGFGRASASRRPLNRDIDAARPCRSGPDPKSRWSC